MSIIYCYSIFVMRQKVIVSDLFFVGKLLLKALDRAFFYMLPLPRHDILQIRNIKFV